MYKQGLWLLPLLSGCFSDPIKTSSKTVSKACMGTYVVQSGDTLHEIARLYNCELQYLAQGNQLVEPYWIYPGQTLQLGTKPQLRFATSKQSKIEEVNPPTTGVRPPNLLMQEVKPLVQAPKEEPPLAIKEEVAEEPVLEVQPISNHGWQWPSKGLVVKHFSEQSHAKKGIEIQGKLGEPIMAAASGKVVYKGNGIRGYGELLILKHENGFLSAYGHNQTILVEEGDTVNRGQVIARMGELSASTYGLHFEIRKQGTPVDPLKYLPKMRTEL